MQMAEMFNNVSKTVKNDLTVTIKKGDKLSVAAACVSIYSCQALKKQLDGIDVLRFLPHQQFCKRSGISYDEMAKQLDTEKKPAQKLWTAQEKILKKVTSSLYGMSGDLQSFADKEIIALPGHENAEGTIKVEKPRGIKLPQYTRGVDDEY